MAMGHMRSSTDCRLPDGSGSAMSEGAAGKEAGKEMRHFVERAAHRQFGELLRVLHGNPRTLRSPSVPKMFRDVPAKLFGLKPGVPCQCRR